MNKLCVAITKYTMVLLKKLNERSHTLVKTSRNQTFIQREITFLFSYARIKNLITKISAADYVQM